VETKKIFKIDPALEEEEEEGEEGGVVSQKLRTVRFFFRRFAWWQHG